ncbi:MAG: hypothetical protein GY841_16420 [FCB group bacterium]|nr:hypothetical protein [FCB group bacterium]
MVNGNLSMLTDGRRLLSCPFFLLYYSPVIGEVANWYGWRRDGCLDPMSIPVAMRRAIENFASGLAAAEVQNMKDDD